MTVVSPPAAPPAASTTSSEGGWDPPPVRSIEDTGLNMGFLSDLTLKVLYFEGYIAGNRIAEIIKLPFAGIVDRALEFLKREQLCEVKGAAGFGESTYNYAITTKGSEKAREVMDRSQYIGPAPVTLDAYTRAMHFQPLRNVVVNPLALRESLSHLVINDTLLAQIGPAVNSGRSMFLYGNPGNGKTAIAESIGRMVLGGQMYIPYAVEIGGQVIKVFDNVNHQTADDTRSGVSTGKLRASRDPRWINIRRPVITVGGELTLESLDLVFDQTNKYYEAPFQMKANGGMFLIDDFGRQQVRPRDLLNRWIVPLEKRIDYLTLHTGRKIEVPFDVLIVFSTNLAPKDLVDEAFLRRIRHKIEIPDPSFDDYREIFRRVCQQKSVGYEERGLGYLLQEYYVKPHRKLRAVHPRDLVDQIVDTASYLGSEPRLTKELIDRACEAYFVEL
jgi:predicted ATPase with chaperone activity